MKTELGFQLRAKVPSASARDVERLIAELRSERRSMSAQELAKALFHKDTETAKRRVRAIARAARPRVLSFPGSDGYDLWKRCKVDEIWHAINAMEAQGADIIKEAAALRRALHSGYRGEPGDDGQSALMLG